MQPDHVYTGHAFYSGVLGNGLKHNRCGHCGRQMLGVVSGRSWKRLMGHPWSHDGWAWWCVDCLIEAGYTTTSLCHLARSRCSMLHEPPAKNNAA